MYDSTEKTNNAKYTSCTTVRSCSSHGQCGAHGYEENSLNFLLTVRHHEEPSGVISRFTETFISNIQFLHLLLSWDMPIQGLADNSEESWSGSFDNQLQCSRLCLLSGGQHSKPPWSNQLRGLTVLKADTM